MLQSGGSGLTALSVGTGQHGDVFVVSLTAPLGAGDGVEIALRTERT